MTKNDRRRVERERTLTRKSDRARKLADRAVSVIR